MAQTVDNAREEDVVRDEMAVSLARLRVIAGQPDLARVLVSANAKRSESFCTGLSELFWTAGSRRGRLSMSCKICAGSMDRTRSRSPSRSSAMAGDGRRAIFAFLGLLESTHEGGGQGRRGEHGACPVPQRGLRGARVVTLASMSCSACVLPSSLA